MVGGSMGWGVLGMARREGERGGLLGGVGIAFLSDRVEVQSDSIS